MKRWLWVLGLAAGVGCSAGGTSLQNPQDGAAGDDGSAGDDGNGDAGAAGQDGAGAGGQQAAGQSNAGTAGTSSQGGAGQSQGGAGQSQGNAGSGGDAGGSAGSGAGGAGGSPVQPSCPDGVTKQAIVYAHTPNVLYQLDPDTKALTKIGGINCGTPLDSVIDLAVNKAGDIYATTYMALVRLDKATAKCSIIKEGSYPNSLSFVPEGTVYPDKEALVGYNGSTYVVIDPVTGAVENKGSIGGGYSSSGDIVSVIGGGTYLTVNGNGCDDCVLSINPSTGGMIENLGKLGYSNVFGLAYWGGVVFGFTDGGQLFGFDVVSKTTTPISIPNGGSGLVFYGAGSTTCARVGDIK